MDNHLNCPQVARRAPTRAKKVPTVLVSDAAIPGVTLDGNTYSIFRTTSSVIHDLLSCSQNEVPHPATTTSFGNGTYMLEMYFGAERMQNVMDTKQLKF
jgi:hypothetical protein